MSAPAVTVVDAFARLTLRLRLSVNAVFPTGLPCESLVVTRTTTSSPFFALTTLFVLSNFVGSAASRTIWLALTIGVVWQVSSSFVADGIIELVPELRLTALKSRCSRLLLPVVLVR